ncbi:MAG: DMP19 family protein [Fluviicola sp.]
MAKPINSSKGKTNDIPITLEIDHQDLYPSDNLDDLLYNLIQKYYPDYDDYSFKNLDSVARTFVLIVNIDGQVQNGGLIQFIDNSTGDYFHETIESAKIIQNEKLVEILSKAATQYPNKQIPKDWDERRELWDSMCEKHENDKEWDHFWDELDKEYYDNANKMNEDLIDYLKKNAKIKE